MVSLAFKTDIAESRSILYLWLSQMFLNEPTVREIEPLIQHSAIEGLKDLFDGDQSGQSFLYTLTEWRDNRELRKEVMQDFHDLFRIPGQKYVLPYESCYREKLIDGTLGTVWGMSTAQVKHLYQQCRVSLTEDQLPDHIGVELIFMHHLSAYESWQWKNRNSKFALRYREWQLGFLKDHLLIWGPELMGKMEKQASTVFCQSLAGLSKQFLTNDLVFLQEMLQSEAN